MMNFDLRPHVTLDPAESQQSEGLEGATLAADAWQDVNENCTFAAAAQTMIDYGYGDPLPPERWREIASPGWHGGESWQATIDVILSQPDLFPHAPPMTIEYPDDVAAAIREYGALGYMVHVGCWCTPDARYIAMRPWNGISHAGRVIYADDGGIAVWNVWTGYLVGLPDDFWRASYDGGGILIFRRSLLPAAPAPEPVPEEDSDMGVISWRAEQHGAFVSDKGVLTHWHYDPASNALLSEALATGLRPFGRAELFVPDAATTPAGRSELHVLAQFPDGSQGLWVYADGGNAWSGQVVEPAPA